MHYDMLADTGGSVCRWQLVPSVPPCSHLRYSAIEEYDARHGARYADQTLADDKMDEDDW